MTMVMTTTAARAGGLFTTATRSRPRRPAGGGRRHSRPLSGGDRGPAKSHSRRWQLLPAVVLVLASEDEMKDTTAEEAVEVEEEVEEIVRGSRHRRR